MSNSPQMGDLLAALTEQQRTMATLIASLSQTSVSEGSSTKTSVPSFPAFDRTKEKWDVYVTRLGQHFEAHRVLADNRKRAYLLSWVVSDTFELLQKLFAGDDVTNVPYDSLVSKLSDYWKKSVHVMAARCLFYRQCLQPGQSYAEWIANLRGIGKDCQFLCPDEKCGKSYLDSLIRIVIVTNTPDEQVRVAALQQSNPSLAQVIQIAEAHEVTRKALTTMKQHPAEVIADVQQIGASVRPTKDGGKGLSDAEQVDSPSMRPLTERGTACWRENRNIWISLKVNGSPLVFQVDTGATSSMVGLRGSRQLGSPECVPTRQALQAYGGIIIPTKDLLNVHVALGEQARRLTLLVTDSEQGSNLMGLDWIDAFSVQLPSCNATYSVDVRDVESAVKYITGKYEAVFCPNLCTCTSFKAHLILKPKAQPKVFKPRPLPFALMDAVKAEAQRLTDSGIWKPVPTSQWAAPIVVAKKSSGGIRICGYFKVTVNPQLEINQFPIPRLIDLADAYLQIELDEASKAPTVVNTPFGLFQYQRLPFGVASAPAIFQQFMAQLISGVPGCAAYLDDIIVTGKDIADHVRNLEILFDRLTAASLRCKLENCTFFRPPWKDLPVILATDASQHGVGAVLLHRRVHYIWRRGCTDVCITVGPAPNAQQKGYSQVEKEGLAIVFGVQKFRQYLYGRHFELLTDHKPLVSIFNPSKAVPVMTAQRLHRWAITLMAYSFNIKYKCGSRHSNADALSRLPMGPDAEFDRAEAQWSELTDSDIHSDMFPVSSNELAQATARDAALSRVVRYVKSEWPPTSGELEEQIRPSWNKRDSISLRKGVLLYGTEFNRAIVPSELQHKVIQLLHQGHWGIVRMKQIARRYCWWPKLDAEISKVGSHCASCAVVAADPRREYQPWPTPKDPWERVHTSIMPDRFGTTCG
uniref:RNA-directed DNA polymerase n=1 Tax=Trichuris muris TaxID=70415 RepID=A0A5S6R6E2_TRIMR